MQHDAKPTSCDEAAELGGYADGGRETARFRCPVGVAEAADGTIYVSALLRLYSGSFKALLRLF
jgi:hypothetical protein